jgi:hypothetical protein
LDRIQSIAVTDEKFEPGDNKSLKHFLQVMKEKCAQEADAVAVE